jgi:hypothetical protein
MMYPFTAIYHTVASTTRNIFDCYYYTLQPRFHSNAFRSSEWSQLDLEYGTIRSTVELPVTSKLVVMTVVHSVTVDNIIPYTS